MQRIKSSIAISLIAALLMSAGSAPAATFTWDGGVGILDNWSNNLNWDPNGAPHDSAVPAAGAVPEPLGMALVAPGILVAAAGRRRRHRCSTADRFEAAFPGDSPQAVA
jgi:hypothetical protein